MDKQLDILRAGADRIVRAVSKLEVEADNVTSQRSHVLSESREMRGEWLERVNQHFDAIDDRVTSFAAEKLIDIEKIKKRVTRVHRELMTRAKHLQEFMFRPDPSIIAQADQETRECDSFIKETHIPKIDIKRVTLSLNRGVKWDNKAAASLELKGGHTVASVPLVIILNAHSYTPCTLIPPSTYRLRTCKVF